MSYLPGSYKIRSGPGVLMFRFQRRRWPEKFTRLRRAASQIEKETLKKRITNIEQGIMNVEVRYSNDLN
jgi:hypothetical protein